MKINPNASNEEVIKEGQIDLYSGLATVSVIAVNPNKAEMHKLGMNYIKEEPSYVLKAKEEGDIDKSRIAFYLKATQAENPALQEDMIYQISFIVSNVQGSSSTGKKLFINEKGRTVYTDSVDTIPAWFDKKGLKPSFHGENFILDFIRKWANIVPDDECMFEDRTAVSQGKVSEIDKLIPMLKENRIVILLGINNRNGKHYSEVYNKLFGSTYTPLDTWFKQLAGAYGKFDAVYPIDLKLKKMSLEEYSEPNPVKAAGTAPFMKQETENPFAKASTESSEEKVEHEMPEKAPTPALTDEMVEKFVKEGPPEIKVEGKSRIKQEPETTNPFFVPED